LDGAIVGFLADQRGLDGAELGERPIQVLDKCQHGNQQYRESNKDGDLAGAADRGLGEQAEAEQRRPSRLKPSLSLLAPEDSGFGRW
jgi:hypothetical protein